MLRKIRIALATVMFALITQLFLDVSGGLHGYLSWVAKIQFWPALLAFNVGIVVALALLTLVFGRIYCSVICPLGVMQDIISWAHGRRKRNRFRYSAEHRWLRYGFLALFAVCFIAGIGSAVALLSPYSAYGRIAENILKPVWTLCNNGLAMAAEHFNSYAFYTVDVWVKSVPTFIIAVVSLLVIAHLAWHHGRTYCNSVCPVGTLLSFLARFSWLKVRIREDKCVNCGLCSRNCKASCIDFKRHKIDYSRCVVCGDCIGKCSKQAIVYSGSIKGFKVVKDSNDPKLPNDLNDLKDPKDLNALPKDAISPSRRHFLLGLTMLSASAATAQQKKKVDGGLAEIEDKIAPERTTSLTPPGSLSAQNMARHCTGCQLCVSQCPNNVLRPSASLLTMMQPMMSYERGFCRPECVRCSQVCPTGAIKPISREEKTAIQAGHAVWIRKNCVPVTDGKECGNCARHCPSGAIMMMPLDENDDSSPMIPSVNEARCIGCGACEYVCPARPFSAIYVEGHEQHREI